MIERIKAVRAEGDSVGGVIEFWEPFPEDMENGDAFELSIGCDRQYTTCKGYGNLPNWRGFGVYIPGVNALTAGPTTTKELGS